MILSNLMPVSFQAPSAGASSAVMSSWIPIAISIFALGISATGVAVTLWDRRARLTIRERRGHWCTLDVIGAEIRFAGMVDVYNSSSRSNSIRGYQFWVRPPNTGGWQPMESEQYTETPQGTNESRLLNATPVVLAPFSGVSVPVSAYFPRPADFQGELRIRIEIEDIFGNWQRLDVTARV